ncbi:MDR family MFS transporter [Flavobacterium sp.]|uniref:MDR family MFS transporter n=1 Tax=Flavobacterium sp. TaxID=239 RepID=UPI004047F4F1
MVRSTINTYHDSFKGLSPQVWWLALITFINRAGTMVLPFMSLYLTKDLHLTLSQVGWVMTSFGVGSLLGSWIGGKLSDTIGFYKVMVRSLFTTGILFISLQFIHTFEGFLIGIFLTMTVADMFRPAMFVSLKAYSKPENRTRSLTLIRLAINLGFSFGPFLGGLIIAFIGYSGLFWVDGITCILAILIMKLVLKEKQIQPSATPVEENSKAIATSVYKDKPFWIFLVVVFLMGFMFLQLFTTMPLYYREIHELSEVQIGLLMSLNGFVIFLFEMPLIHYIEQKSLNKLKIIAWSLLLFSVSFLILNTSLSILILISGMLFITFGEMLGFPFTNNFAMDRAPSGKEGRYLALYSMAFSFAHIFSAKVGMEMIDQFGFAVNWYFMGSLGILAFGLMIWLKKSLN